MTINVNELLLSQAYAIFVFFIQTIYGSILILILKQVMEAFPNKNRSITLAFYLCILPLSLH